MSKKKDHLFDLDQVAQSVLLGKTIKSLCGVERRLTRDDLNDTRYYPGCKDCMAAAGKDAIARQDVVSIHPKEGWQRLIEKAWLNRYEASVRPTVTTWNATTTYVYTARGGDAPKSTKGPDAV